MHQTKRPKLKVDNTPPSSSEVKKAWNFVSTPLTRLNNMALVCRSNMCKDKDLTEVKANLPDLVTRIR
jgi:hypothetical protein